MVVITGDFNCNPASFEFQAFLKILGPDFIDAYMHYSTNSGKKLEKGHDVTMEGESNRLDYVFFKVCQKKNDFAYNDRKTRIGTWKALKSQ